MRVLVLTSGGVDSTTSLGMAVEKYGKENVVSMSVSYGQKHSKELEASKAVAEYYGVEHIYVNLAEIFKYSDCSLLEHSDKDIPHDTYANQLKDTDGEPVSTYVPFRNGLFLATAASVAISRNCEAIYYGAHSDDAAGSAYPDCSAEFNKAIGDAIYIGSGKSVRVEAPFVQWTKKDIVKEGLKINVPYHLTWSCYEGKDKPCGKCGTCIDREKAFALNGCIDPLLK
jgi:7-cyano-7-deazaguanine synthase